MAMGCPVHPPLQLNSQPRLINLQDPVCVTWRVRDSGVQSLVSSVSGQSCPQPHFLLLHFSFLCFPLFNSSSRVLSSLSASLPHTLPVILSFPFYIFLPFSLSLTFFFFSFLLLPHLHKHLSPTVAQVPALGTKMEKVRHSDTHSSENTDPSKKSFEVNFLVSLNLSAISQGTFHRTRGSKSQSSVGKSLF